MIEHDMDFMQYRAHEGINASALKKGRTSLLHMHHEMTRGTNTPTPAMLLGTNVHTAVLEPERFAGEVVVWRKGAKMGKLWTRFNRFWTYWGKTIVTPSDLDLLGNIRDSVHSHPEAVEIITGCDKEASVFWESPEVYGFGKARFDMFTPNEIWGDLKSTSKIHPREFQSHAEKMGYFHQCGWAAEGMNRLGLSMEIGYYIVAVETSPPFDVVVYELDFDDVMSAREECRKIATKYNLALKSGEFAGVASDGIQTLRRPEWCKPKPVLDFS